jgi:Domain of unknown function (DUF4265)
MIKVSFDLDHTDWHGHPSETLWADPVPMLGPYAFRLHNSPFFKRGIAYRDIVDTTPTEGEQLFDFKRVIRRGGHSTYMILVSEDEPRFQQHWNDLQALGCTYEWGQKKFSIGHRRFYSVDVPPSADLDKVVAILERGEGEGTWMYQEGYRHRA